MMDVTIDQLIHRCRLLVTCVMVGLIQMLMVMKGGTDNCTQLANAI